MTDAAPQPLINLASDNVVGASQKVIEAIVQANDAAESSYGCDRHCARAEQLLRARFGEPLDVFMVVTGTAANALALATVSPPWGAVLCHAESHIVEEECGAPEMFTGGARLAGIAGANGKLTPTALEDALRRFTPGAPRSAQPAALSVSQVTEAGTVYSVDELAALTATARRHGLRTHMDGSRFANALVTLGCTPAQMTRDAGIDIMSLGATKNGALACEAVLVFDPALAASLQYQRKRSGHTLSKGRLLGAQMAAWLDADHWLDNARHANAMAARLVSGLGTDPRVRLPWPTQANEVFAVVPTAICTNWERDRIAFSPWLSQSLPQGFSIGGDEAFVRMVTSHATREADIDAVLASARGA